MLTEGGMLFLCCTTSKWPFRKCFSARREQLNVLKEKSAFKPALAKILAFYNPTPPVLLQLVSKKKYFHPAGLPCNETSQNLCVNLQTGCFSGIWALPAVIYSFMWHLFPACSRASSGQGNVGTCQESHELLSLWKGSNGHCKGLEGEEFSALATPPSCWQWSHEPFSPGISSALCVILSSFLLPFHQTRDSTPRPNSQSRYQKPWMDTSFQLISIALIYFDIGSLIRHNL